MDELVISMPAVTTIATTSLVYIVTNPSGTPVDNKATFDSFQKSITVLTTPDLGTPSAGIATNLTGTAASLTAGHVTTNANLTGPVTSVGNATAIANGAISNAMLANGAVANLSGTNTGDQTSVSGNAGTATALATPRAIYGNNFDGSAALSQVIASTYGGTGNGFTKFSGPTTSEKTKTLRDANDTILELGGSYTPTGTWTSLTLVTPALGTPASGVGTNITGITAAHVVAGTFGTGAYTMDTSLTVPQILNTPNAITATSNAATVTRANRTNNVTNNSASGITITLSTSGAQDGDLIMVRSYPSSNVAQTITWVNTENSSVTPSANLNAATTSPRTDGFQYNSATSKWRCIASC